MKIDVVSIFPDYLAPLRLSLVGKAIESGIVDLDVHDLRDWTHDRHRTVDDTPYGGGAGMVMKPEPWGAAIDQLGAGDRPPRLLLMSPAGRRFDQQLAEELAAEDHLLIGCGRYEGIDARVAEDAARRLPTDEISIGDYVLNGGEAAALVIIESVVRLLPGVIGNPESLAEESHAAGHDQLLEYPLYTKPPSWRGLDVPEILFSGHHAKIADWRRERAEELTRQRRPDLYQAHRQTMIDNTAVGRLAATSIDCPDPAGLAAFYAALLGMGTIFQNQDTGLVVISDGARILTFMRVEDYRAPSWPDPERPQQLHLDVAVADLPEAVARAVALGAREAGHQPRPEVFRVLLDPAGHPFCLTTAGI